MLKLHESKEQTEHLAIRKAKVPSRLFLPLSQHLGRPCLPQVKVGDIVRTGQLIGNLEEKTIFAPVHSSVSGRVTAIDNFPHPLLGVSRAIAIDSDGLDEKIEFKIRVKEEIEKLPSHDLRRIIADAGICGMGGAGFPTAIKLTPPKPIDSFILNGAECEPYVTCDSRLMIEKTEEIILGTELAVKCVGAKQSYIAIEENKHEAIKEFQTRIRKLKQVGNVPLKLVVLKSKYPQGGEKQLIKSVLKREVPPGKFPFDAGVVVQNVATIFAVYEAVYSGKPLYERAATLTGDCLSNPGNLLVRIGTTIKDLMEECGPFKKEPEKIIFGGPMMGLAQYNLNTPIIKNTNGIIFLSEAEVPKAEEAFCLRCSRCVANCPLGLMPNMIAMSVEKGRWDLAKAYGALECMECGACSYVCPQARNIVQAVKEAKQRIPK